MPAESRKVSLYLDVPLVPESAYVQFLADRGHRVHSLHFSLYADGVVDARHRFSHLPLEALVPVLKEVPAQRRYLLLNSRFHRPSNYRGAEGVRLILDPLVKLLAEGMVDGIVFADFYLLQVLSAAAPEMAQQLEAVPSVNAMLDSVDKIRACLGAVERTGFKGPGKLVLDRSLNRRPAALAAVSAWCRRQFPEIRLELLANEGCLYQCPFKPAHDAHIALNSMGVALDTFRLNRDHGCMQILNQTPALLFQSPFIRPEDAHRYRPWVDGLKLCGRTLGPRFLERVVGAYLGGRYAGNLLDLMDALDWLAGGLSVANERIPTDFFQTLTTCDRDCPACGYCAGLLKTCAGPRRVHLPDLRGQPTVC